MSCNALQSMGVDSQGIRIKLNEHEINKKLGHLIQLTCEHVDLNLWFGDPWVPSLDMVFVTYINPNYTSHSTIQKLENVEIEFRKNQNTNPMFN
jgi:hypothetical protein